MPVDITHIHHLQAIWVNNVSSPFDAALPIRESSALIVGQHHPQHSFFFKWRLVAPSFLTARGTQVCDSLAQVGHEVKHGGSQTLVDEVAWQTALGGQKRLVKGENTLAYEGSRQRQYTVARMYKTVLVTNQCLT